MIRISSSRSLCFVRIFCLFLSLSFFRCPPALAGDSDKALAEILSSAEFLFKAMRERNYPAVWGTLTAASQGTIIDDTRKAIARAGGKEIPEEELRKDFDTGGAIARGYWNSFLEQFNTSLALEQSKWEKGTIGSDRAEILITCRTSEKPALLRLFREDGGWKVGLVETFWGRK